MARVFISHSSRDKEPAERIMAWLSEQGFETPFLDFDKHGGIQPGADWEKTLYREIERAEAIVIIQTPNWLDSKWCFAEFTQARALGKAIFPIIETPTGDTLISPDIQALDLLKDREGGLEQLSSQLTQIALDAQGGFDWDVSRPPYPGLLAFQEEDAALYFGRDDDIRRLIERLDARRAQGGEKLIALLGASGSGKSSLLRAGVIPRLKRAARNWVVLPAMRPQVRPVDELARTLAVGCGGDEDWRKLREELNGDNLAQSLSDFANDLRMRASANEAQILLPIDQGEELFGAADPDQARRFCEILNVALSSDLPFIAVIAMRSDYLGLLQSAEHLTARFEEFSIAPMPLARIAQIIEGPARVAGLGIDEVFVHRAVQDAKTEDALPLLAFALRELYDHAADDNYLSLAEYNALGDAKEELSPLENAVRKAADNVLAEAGPANEELTALREAFVPAMVRVNEQGEYVRRPARWDDLPSKSHALLERLAKARLLIVRQDGDDRMVEVAHEALLRKWPHLRSWLDDAREFLTGKQQLERDLHDWEHATDEDKTGALLTGLKLNRARGWLIERPHQLTAKERALIQASIDHAEAEERRKVRLRRNITRTSIAAALVLAVATVASVIQWTKAESARNDTQKQLARSEQLLYVNSIQSAQREWETNNVAAAWQHLDNCRENLRGWEYRYLHSLFTRNHETLKGHNGSVNSVAFSPNGSRIVSGSRDNSLKLWNAYTGEETKTLKGHTEDVESVAFNHDGSRIVSGSQDGTVKLWDASRGVETMTFTGHNGWVKSVAFSPDGSRIVSGGGKYGELDELKVWDAHTGKQKLALKGHTGEVDAVAFNHDGSRIVSGGYDRTPRLWDPHTGEKKLTLKGHTGWVYAVAFNHDGSRVVSGGFPNTVKLWDASTGEEKKTLYGHTRGVLSVAFSPNGKRIVSGSQDRAIKVWDARTGEEKFTLKGNNSGVRSVAFNHDGSRIIGGGEDNTVKLWDARASEGALTLRGHNQRVNSVAFSPDGSRIVSGGDDNNVKLWDADTGKETTLRGHDGWVWAVAFSPDGSRIVSGSRDGTLKLWNASTGKETKTTLKGHTGWVYAVAFSPDGSRIVSGGHDETLKLWDASTGKVTKTLEGHTGRVSSVAFSPDGSRIVSGSGDKTVNLWDASTGKKTITLEGHNSGVKSVAFSPDGSRIVSGSLDKTVKLWDVNTGENPKTFTGHTKWVSSVAFSPDGSRIVSGGHDETLKLWDASTGDEILTLKGHNAYVTSVAFSPDGSRIVSGSFDGTVKVWDALGEGPFSRWRRAASAESGEITNHEYRATLGEKNNDWYAAAFHLGRLIALNPVDASLKQRRSTVESKLREKGLLIPIAISAK